jgi:hypothetical protein
MLYKGFEIYISSSKLGDDYLLYSATASSEKTRLFRSYRIEKKGKCAAARGRAAIKKFIKEDIDGLC